MAQEDPESRQLPFHKHAVVSASEQTPPACVLTPLLFGWRRKRNGLLSKRIAYLSFLLQEERSKHRHLNERFAGEGPYLSVSLPGFVNQPWRGLESCTMKTPVFPPLPFKAGQGRTARYARRRCSAVIAIGMLIVACSIQ